MNWAGKVAQKKKQLFLAGDLRVIKREPDDSSRQLRLLDRVSLGVDARGVGGLVLVGHERHAEGEGLAWKEK